MREYFGKEISRSRLDEHRAIETVEISNLRKARRVARWTRGVGMTGEMWGDDWTDIGGVLDVSEIILKRVSLASLLVGVLRPPV